MRYLRLNIFILILTICSIDLFSNGKENIEPFGFNEDWKIVHQGMDEIKDYVDKELLKPVTGAIAMDESNSFGVAIWTYLLKDSLNQDISVLQVNTTADCGETWTKETVNFDYKNFYLISLNVFSDGIDKRTVYATFTSNNKREHLFIKSTDNCKTWITSKIDSTYEKHKAFTNGVDYPKSLTRIDENTLFWTFWGNIFKSTDGGVSWKNYAPSVISDFEDGKEFFFTTAYSKEDNSLAISYYSLQIGKGACILFTTDDGVTWEELELTSGEITILGGLNSYLNKSTWYAGRTIKVTGNTTMVDLFKTDDSALSKKSILHYEYDTQDDYNKGTGNEVDIYENGRVILYNSSNRACFLSQDYGKTFDQIIDTNNIEDRMGMRPGFEGMAMAWTKCGDVLAMLSHYNVILKYNPNSSISTDIEKFNTKIYPNPSKANSKVYVSLENDKQRSAICKVFNLTGELIEESQEIAMPKGCHTLDFKTDGYITGTYFLVIESNGEIIAREKFVVE